MLRRWRAAALVCLGLLASACAGTQRDVHTVSVHRYWFGLAGGRAVDVRDLCRSGRARSVEVTRSAWAYVASVATLGIYLPHQVRVECSAR